MTIEQFGQQIKSKYPQYNDLPDAEVGQKVLTKYPQYSDMIDSSDQEPPQQAENLHPTFNPEAKPNADLAIGVAKSGGTFLDTLSKGGQFIANKVGGLFGMKEKPYVGMGDIVNKPDLMTPKNEIQQAGKTMGDVLQFLAPSSKTVQAEKLIQGGIQGLSWGIKYGKAGNMAAKVLELASRSGIEATTFAGLTALQGKSKEEIRKSAEWGAMMPVFGEVLGGIKDYVGKGLIKTGEKIETSLIKPSQTDVKDGFNVKNIFKYDLSGDLKTSFDKTSNNLEYLSNQLREVIGESKNTINLDKVYNKVESKLLSAQGKTKMFGANTKISSALDYLKNEIISLKNPVVSIPDAQIVKRASGLMGAWQYGARDPEATAMEKVFNEFYTELKVSIEKNSPPGVEPLNKAISELIPIQNAIIRRIPIAERNQSLGIIDALSLVESFSNPKALSITILNNILKSGKVAGVAFKKGEKMLQPTENEVLRRFLGR